nr:uncharacterized protein LOC118086951 isoform X2 [Zootoca vivipara]
MERARWLNPTQGPLGQWLEPPPPSGQLWGPMNEAGGWAVGQLSAGAVPSLRKGGQNLPPRPGVSHLCSRTWNPGENSWNSLARGSGTDSPVRIFAVLRFHIPSPGVSIAENRDWIPQTCPPPLCTLRCREAHPSQGTDNLTFAFQLLEDEQVYILGVIQSCQAAELRGLRTLKCSKQETAKAILDILGPLEHFREPPLTLALALEALLQLSTMRPKFNCDMISAILHRTMEAVLQGPEKEEEREELKRCGKTTWRIKQRTQRFNQQISGRERPARIRPGGKWGGSTTSGQQHFFAAGRCPEISPPPNDSSSAGPGLLPNEAERR